MPQQTAINKILSILCLLAFFTATLLVAQYKSKRLHIINVQSKVPLAGASIKSVANDFEASADENGIIYLGKSALASPGIEVRCVGYRNVTIDLDTLPFAYPGAVIGLTPAIASLREITLTSVANRGIFKTIGEMDIHLGPINNSQEVLRIVPGLFIGQHAGGGKAEQIFLRGFDKG
jgi:hypothetical protein